MAHQFAVARDVDIAVGQRAEERNVLLRNACPGIHEHELSDELGIARKAQAMVQIAALVPSPVYEAGRIVRGESRAGAVGEAIGEDASVWWAGCAEGGAYVDGIPRNSDGIGEREGSER